MADLKLTRDQLAKFLPDHEAVKQFEALFNMTNNASSDVDALFAAPPPPQINDLISAIDALRNEMALLHASPARYVETINSKYGQVLFRISDLPSTPSSELAAIISDETGSGSLVFADTPVFSNATNSVVTSQGLSGVGSFKALSSGTNSAEINFANSTTGQLFKIQANNSATLDFITASGTLLARYDSAGMALYKPTNIYDTCNISGTTTVAGNFTILDNGVDAIELNNTSFFNSRFYVENGAGYIFHEDAVGDTLTIATGGAITTLSTIKPGGFTVATLPAGVAGAEAYVTNALAPAWNVAVVGGGAVNIAVRYNGAAWVCA